VPDDDSIELYQLVGSALRDVAQARFMSDMYTRQISFGYERDAVLRRFPVPRVEIEEAQIVLHFAVKHVRADPARATSRHAAMGSLFDQYSVRIVRESISLVRAAVRDLPAQALNEPQRAAITNFEKKVQLEDSRDALSGRLLQYFNENADRMLKNDGALDVATVEADLGRLSISILKQPETLGLKQAGAALDWNALARAESDLVSKRLGELSVALQAVKGRYPDYSIDLELDPEKIRASALPMSSITIKSSVKGYSWSKVDVDETDMRNVRTLTAE